jgi:uncharacterized protein YecE (DUF72 family)
LSGNLFDHSDVVANDAASVWRVGTSGWSYPPSSGPGSWAGVFYPLARTDELKFYSRYFNTVEVNSTFYRPCAPKTAESWAKRTSDSFEFTVKAWQGFTHKKEIWLPADIDQFKEGIAPLSRAGKLGCILFQFPASFRYTGETSDRLNKLLSEFGEFPKAVELRHRSWDENLQLLEEFGAVPAFIDEPKFHDSIRQDFGSRGGILYVRLHGRNAQKWWRHEHRNDRYDYLYSKEELRPFAIRLKEVVNQKVVQKAYVFFNNHPNAKAVANAVMLRAELDIPVETELPERLREHFPEIDTL